MFNCCTCHALTRLDLHQVCKQPSVVAPGRASRPNLGPILANLRQVGKVKESEAKLWPGGHSKSRMSEVRDAEINRCRFFEQTSTGTLLSKQSTTNSCQLVMWWWLQRLQILLETLELKEQYTRYHGLLRTSLIIWSYPDFLNRYDQVICSHWVLSRVNCDCLETAQIKSGSEWKLV